jgi:glutathione S-transferase
MTDKITFYHNPQSRGRIVHWMLEEAAHPYNPAGKIPAIFYRGTV